MRLLAVVLVALMAVATTRASHITVTDARLVWPPAVGNNPSVEFTLAWNNAWRNSRNHDGAWVFVKAGQAYRDAWLHASVGSATAEWAGDGPAVPAACTVATDATGVFIAPGADHRGAVRWRVRLELTTQQLARARDRDKVDVLVNAIEMVHVPRGPFYVGDAGEEARQYAAFFRSDSQGKPAGLFHITSEAEIPIGADDGSLFYESPGAGQSRYGGDQLGPVPESFPKGHRAFWCMKYELSQGQYASFLNNLRRDQAAFRAGFAVRGYSTSRGSISIADDRYIAAAPHRAANFTSWDDACAFADWAALRPMTELEFTKACRGPNEPITRDYPWGSASKDRLLRVVGPDQDLMTAGDADESTLSDERREILGASHWWIMDLAGSLWERCITIGHPAGRAFAGTHGDGNLTAYGRATNADWPAGDEGKGGFGYRGGGWYGPDHTYEPNGFNPHSPVEWRRFGSWGDGPRTIAYGFRAVRTANE